MKLLLIISSTIVFQLFGLELKADDVNPTCDRIIQINTLGLPARVENLQVRGVGFPNSPEYALKMTAVAELIAEKIQSNLDGMTPLMFKELFMEIAIVRSNIQVALFPGDWNLWRTWRVANEVYRTAFKPKNGPGYQEAMDGAVNIIIKTVHAGKSPEEIAKIRRRLTKPRYGVSKYARLPSGDIRILDWHEFVWVHPNAWSLPAIFEHVETLFQKTMRKNISQEKLIKLVAEIQWWVAHAAPLYRGSAATMDTLSKAIFYAHGIVPGKWKEGVAPDIVAFYLPLNAFVSVYPQLFE